MTPIFFNRQRPSGTWRGHLILQHEADQMDGITANIDALMAEDIQHLETVLRGLPGAAVLNGHFTMPEKNSSNA